MGLSSLENMLAITVWVSWVLTHRHNAHIFKFIYLYQGGEEERIVCSKPEDPRQSMMGAERVVETQF